MVHVPYKGAGPMRSDLLGGQIKVAVDALPQNLPLRRSGQLRLLAVTAARRVAQAPDLPTVLAQLAPGLIRLDVCPVFWAANGHVQRDLPALLEDARRAHPGVELRLRPVLSELPGMLAFLAQTVVGLTGGSVPASTAP